MSQTNVSSFKNLDLPVLDEKQSEDLGRPISLEELESALKGAKKGKSPGPDGVPPELSLHFSGILRTVLLE